VNEESLFAAALEKPPGDERNRFLDQACGDDAELRRRIEILLGAHDDLGGILDQSSPHFRSTVGESPRVSDSPAPVGTIVAGRYRLLELIGEGGMGDVFFAEQTEPVRRKVAIKLTKPGFQSRSVLARFEKERQALAVMDHPNIAKVLDGGVTDTGRPFFVMEYLKGSPITEYCDEVRMPIRQRLELFADACQAVQHAHQKGIIHRDLKPSNILVALYDDKPVVKVIDFGLAKGIDQPLLDGTNVTGHAVLLGTPRYMSPEQTRLNNLDIDTRSDIYSLGVVLYELLTGSTPVDQEQFQTAGWDERLRMIREVDPPTPSTRLNSSKTLAILGERRQLQPARLCRTVRGELDWIVMKALEKDRERRYETAIALEKDVKNYLKGEPVAASPPSKLYRLRKFARRNRFAIAAGTAIISSLVVGLGLAGASLYNAHIAARAERQAKLEAQENEVLAIQAVERFVNAVTSNKELRENPALAPLRKELMKEPLAYFDTLRHNILSGGELDPTSTAKLLAAMREYVHATHSLGDPTETLRMLQECVPIATRLTEKAPGELIYWKELTQLHDELALLYRQAGKYDLAIASHNNADHIYDKLIRDFPDTPYYQEAKARSLQYRGFVLSIMGDVSGAIRLFEKSSEMLTPLLERTPTDASVRIQKGTALHWTADHLFRQGKISEAVAVAADATDLIENAVLQSNNDKLFGSLLKGSCWQLKAKFLSAEGKVEQAIAASEKALQITDDVVHQYPLDLNNRLQLAVCQRSLATTLLEAGQLENYVVAFENAEKSFEYLSKESPTDLAKREEWAECHSSIATAYRRLNNTSKALVARQRAIEILEERLNEHQATLPFFYRLENENTRLANLLGVINKPEEGLIAARKAIAIGERMSQQHKLEWSHLVDNANAYNTAGVMHRKLKDFHDACKAHENALLLCDRASDEYPDVAVIDTERFRTHDLLAICYAELGRFSEAGDLFRKAIEHQKKMFKEHPGDQEHRRKLAGYLGNFGYMGVVQKDANVIKEAESELSQLALLDPKFAVLDQRISTLANEGEKAMPEELLKCASRAYGTYRFALALRFWCEALEREPELQHDRSKEFAYNAACCASLHASGRGVDAQDLDESKKAALRDKTYDWLRGELSAWRKSHDENRSSENSATVARTMRHWQVDQDIDSIRGDSINNLPETERPRWIDLWKEVDELKQKAEAVTTEGSPPAQPSTDVRDSNKPAP
jgi:serine/threonine protein kinase